jgi:hypothetical protein
MKISVKNDSTSRVVKFHEGPPMAHKVARLGCAPARAEKILIPKHTGVFISLSLLPCLFPMGVKSIMDDWSLRVIKYVDAGV